MIDVSKLCLFPSFWVVTPGAHRFCVNIAFETQALKSSVRGCICDSVFFCVYNGLCLYYLNKNYNWNTEKKVRSIFSRDILSYSLMDMDWPKH